jgi:striatin 1/3/4
MKQSRDNNARNKPPVSGDDQLANVSLKTEEPEVKEEDTGLPKSWVSKRMLKSHLDIVRSVAIASGPGILVASGGDDNTVKIWSVDASSLASSKWVCPIDQKEV